MLKVEIIDRIDRIDPVQWDACVPRWDPFAEHRFLALLEGSGSASPANGWVPCHIVVWQGETLVGALPLYLKDHSYGEYIFDWGWADASQRAGIPYYPKLSCAIPFTPATGRRLLVRDGAVKGPVVDALMAGVDALLEKTQASSFHMLFCTGEEQQALTTRAGFIPRTTHQFHWVNEGYDDFEGYLATFRSRDRKKVRKEREKAQVLCAGFAVLHGEEITDAHWQAMESFYRDTTGRKWGSAYLSPDWFLHARQQLGDRLVCLFALDQGQVVAGALTLHKGNHLYGRYWGAHPDYRKLHFELCYHRPIELCIQNGWGRFEAGAQGAHKLKRGLRPQATHSLHWIRHPGLAAAVADALHEESLVVHHEIEALDNHAPFRSEDP